MHNKKSKFFMSPEARNEYLRALVEKLGYFSLSKKEKSRILDEYCKITGMNRNYVIRKINKKGYLKEPTAQKRGRKVKYDQEFVEILKTIWEQLNYPCGKKLAKTLKDDLERIFLVKTIGISPEIEKKLKKISSSTIDLKLKDIKKILKNRSCGKTS